MLRAFLEDKSGKNKLKKTLYQMIHEKGVASKVEFIDEIKVPQTTITRMVDELLEKKLIQVCGYGESSGGRPPLLFEVVPDAGYLIGVEIARTHVNIILQNIKFQTIDQQNFRMTKKHNPEYTIHIIIKTIQSLLEKYSLGLNQLVGIGVGAVGPLDREKGVILAPDEFLSGKWENIPISAMLEFAFPVAISLNNGANTAALAEYKQQPLKKEDILYCRSGVGIRCSYINKKGFQQNQVGDASSYGHMIIVPNGKECHCGRRGCLNAYASYNEMFRNIEEYKGNENITNEHSITTVDDLINSIKNNQLFVKNIVKKSAYYYGIGIANMVNILHPSTVILHGKLIYQYNEYFEEIVKVATEHIYTTRISNRVLIKKGQLAENAAAIGAAVQVFYNQFE